MSVSEPDGRHDFVSICIRMRPAARTPPPPADTLATPADVKRAIKGMLTNTWVTFEHLAGTLFYCSGSTAGTPLADIVFTAAFVRTLKNIRERLDGDGLIDALTEVPQIWSTKLQTQTSCKVFEVSYCDDSAFPILAKPELIALKI